MKLIDVLKEALLQEVSVYKVINPKFPQDKSYYFASREGAGRAKAQLIKNNTALGVLLRNTDTDLAAVKAATTLEKVPQDFDTPESAREWIAANGDVVPGNVGASANRGIEKVFNILRTFYNQKSSIIKRTGGSAAPTEREKNVQWFVAASDITKTVNNLKELLRDYNDAKRTQSAGGTLDNVEQQLLALAPEDLKAVEKYAENFKKYVDTKHGFKKQATDQSPEQVYYPIQTRLVSSIPNPRATSDEEPTDEYDPFAEPEVGGNDGEVDDSLDFKDLGNFIKNNPGIVSKIAKTSDPKEKLDQIEANLNKLTFSQLEGLAKIQKDPKVAQAIENLIDKKEQTTMARGKNKYKQTNTPSISKDVKNIFKNLEDKPEDVDTDSMSIKHSVRESLKNSSEVLQEAKKFFSK
jgi:hypothetical protein